jgi:hypothetical protein
MAQIIKHRRGSIGSLKSTTARNAELIIASGSISDLSGPFVFIGSPNSGDEGIAGAFNTVSKLYTGTNAPTITAATYGSGLDGTPYYASGDKSLYILNNSNVGNTKIDLSGNIEGNTISSVTINNLTGTTAYIANISGSLTGSGQGLYDIPATGITGLDLSKIYSGSVQVTTDSVTGEIHLDATAGIYATGSNVTIGGGNDSYISLSTWGYVALYSNQGGTDVAADNGGNLWLWAEGGGDVHIGAYSGQTVEIGRETDMGNIAMLNGSGNTLNIYGDTILTGSLFATKIEGTGSLYLQPDQSDSRLFEIYNTTGVTGNDIHIKGNTDYNYFGGDINYLKLDDAAGYVTIVGDNGVTISSNVGNVNISSYDGSTLYLNNDGGEGDINIGNYGNSIYGYTNTTDFWANNYAQLGSSGSFVWVESIGAHLHNDSGSAGVGFTARPNGIIEATGSLFVNGDTNIDGNTSVTGSLVVTAGAAVIDQGVISQNSNVLLTSGSNLIIQDFGNLQVAGDVYITGSEAVDYIYGYTQQWNYLALNGSTSGTPNVELGSTGNISLWAEGGTVNVTGSIKVTNDLIVEQNMFVSGNIYQTGSFYTQGDIVLSGSINIGDNIGVDTINFQGEVSSSILPKISDVFDLGGPSNYWHDLYVSGTAHVGVLEASSISLSGITVFNDLQVSGSIYNFTLTPTDVVFVDADQRLTGSAAFTYAYDGDYGDNVLTAPIIRASNDGNGTNFLIGNDMWLGDVNEGNATRFMGNEDNNIAKIYLGSTNTNNYLQANYGDISLSSNNTLYLQSQNDKINIDAYDGNLNLNTDSNNNVSIGGHTYINNRNLYVNKVWDNSDNANYLELYGYNTNDGYWWESGSGADTTLNNNWGGANTNILNTNSGNVNIDATNGSVNLHSNNGFNVTGSMIVSDGSGVFNSSLIVNNSDLTLDGGTNQHMNDGAHLYFHTCVDMYYDSGDGNFIFYNDCNNFQFRNNVSITGSLNISSGIYTDNIYGASNSSNVLRLNGGAYNAPNVELASSGQISLFSEGGSGVNFAINMTGSVHMANDLDVTGSLYVGQIYNYNNSINNGGIYIDSGNYSEISYNDEEVYLGVDASGIWGTSNSGTTIFTSNAGDTTINANNGYNVNINANNILLNGDTAVTGTLSVSSDIMTDGNLYVSGNLEVLGSSTNVHLESHTVNIGDNIILVNAYSPFQRYAGLAAFDSGSLGASGSVSGSLLWDSLNDYWMFVSASGQSSKLVGTTAGTYGSENSLTSGTIPIATGDNNIGDSLLTYSGTTLAYNTNKFTIDSVSGATYINGNVTLNSGASDLGLKTSGIVFRNDDDVLGFVSTTETTDVMDGVLGYRSSDGVLVFSTVIDGGSY